MNAQKTKKLSDLVRIRRQYQRSIRLDADFGRTDALDGYVCHKTAADVLDAMAKQISGSNQRAFTWTGPFGGGKSSLAVALASALGPDESLRAKAREALRLDSHPNFDEALPVSRGWLVLPVVGRRGFVSEEISKTLNHALGSNTAPGSATEVVADLCSAAADERYDGVLLVIDEMGKFLEAAALGLGDDVLLFSGSGGVRGPSPRKHRRGRRSAPILPAVCLPTGQRVTRRLGKGPRPLRGHSVGRGKRRGR